jgi:hypothetical protein
MQQSQNIYYLLMHALLPQLHTKLKDERLPIW